VNIIKVKDLSFRYHGSDNFTLKEIDFRVKKGEIIGITGKSGCGKSTLLYSLSGIIPHTVKGEKKGSVNVCGLDTEKHDIATLTTNIGFIFQNPEIQLFNVSVEDELAFIAENLNYSPEKIRRCVEFALDALDIRHLRNRYPFDLSGGEKQKVALASVISVKPEVLVLDEPTSELDARGRTAVLETLEKLNNEGMTIILAEHNLDEALPLMDRLMVLDDGRIRILGKPEDVFRNNLFFELGLRAPQSVEVGMKLRQRKMTLTIDDAAICLKDNVSNLKILRDAPQTLHRDPVIEVKNLSFQSNNRNILNDINLIVKHGEVVGLVGENGSGKTTLAMILTGLLKPTAGNVKVMGRPVEGDPREVHERVGFLFQNPENQLFCNSVKSEIAYGTEKLNENLVSKLIKQMDLEKFRDKHPLTLSRGERQRVAAATALSRDPDILIVDEPTTGQDWNHVKAFMDLLIGLNKEGKTIILITHDMRVVAEYCTRLLVMRNGEIIMDSSTRNAFANIKLLKKAGLRPAPISEISLMAGINPPILRVDEIKKVNKNC